MGLGSFFRSVVDREFLGKDIIKKQIEIYYQQKRLYPDQPQHIHLAQVWLSRQAAQGLNISSLEVQTAAYYKTLLSACIPHPQCAEALGLYILLQERPDIVNDYRYFSESFHHHFDNLMKLDTKRLRELYIRYNPNMKKDDVDSLFQE